MNKCLISGLLCEQNENIPQIEKETHRLAVVNLDWRYVKVCALKFCACHCFDYI